MKIKENVKFVSFIGFSKNLWIYQGFFLEAFKFYTFSSWLNYNHWVGVCYFIPLVHVSFINVALRFFFIKNLNFSFLGQVLQYCLLSFKSVLVEVRIIWYQSQVLKAGLQSFYLLFVVIILSCSICVHYSLFLFCFVHQVKKQNKVILKKNILSFTIHIKVIFFFNRKFCSFSSLKKSDFYYLRLIRCFYNIFLAVSIGLN
jgi:hypothetical protein